MNSLSSESKLVDCGISQGSILGNLSLYYIFIDNRMFLETFLYADDMNIAPSGNSEDDIFNTVVAELGHVFT